MRKNPTTRPCAVDGCDRMFWARDLCGTHYNRRQRGDANWDRPIYGDGRFRGPGRTVSPDGYVFIRIPADDPMATTRAYRAGDKYAYVAEHRWVMSQKLGRALTASESVHHVNGKKDDNRPENLELWVTTQPRGQRVEDRVADAADLLHRYAPHLLADGGHALPLAV